VPYPGYTVPGTIVIPPYGPAYEKPPLPPLPPRPPFGEPPRKPYELTLDPKLAVLANPYGWPTDLRLTAPAAKAEDDEKPQYSSWLLTWLQDAASESRKHTTEMMVQHGTKQTQVVALYRYAWDGFELGGQVSGARPTDHSLSETGLKSSALTFGPVAHVYWKNALDNLVDIGFYAMPQVTYDSDKKQWTVSVQVVAAASLDLYNHDGYKLSAGANFSPTWLGANTTTLGGKDLRPGTSYQLGAGLTFATPWWGLIFSGETYGNWMVSKEIGPPGAPFTQSYLMAKGAVGFAVAKNFDAFVKYVGLGYTYQWDSAKLFGTSAPPPAITGSSSYVTGVIGF
jgi:hypothetical protein